MATPEHTLPSDDLPDDLAADLAALADGRLPAARRAALEERMVEEPALAAALAEQRRALEVLEAVAPPAPERLRARVAAEGRRAQPALRRRRLGFGVGLAVVAAALLLTALFLLPAGVSGGTVIAEAAALHSRPSAEPAPPAASRTLLEASFEGVRFPNYLARFGWRAEGQRADEVRGRGARTVFYRNAEGQRIGYTVLAGAPLQPPDEARRARGEGGALLRSFDVGGRTVVVVERGGHTCVVSGIGVPRRELYRLAGWTGMGTLDF
jgi:hypothetical protein